MTDNTHSWHQQTKFDHYQYADWRSSAEKLLAGADFDQTLIKETLDGIAIQPLYEQTPHAPFISRCDKPWSIQQHYGHGSIEDVNKKILSHLADGINTIELNLATSQDSAAVACFTADELEHLLTDVQPQMIGVSLPPGSHNRLTGALLLAYYYRQKIAPADVRCALNIDPLATQAATGQCAKSALGELASYARYCETQFPNATALCVDSSTYHNAGCTEAQELAYILATTVEYLRALKTLDADTACKQIKVRIALDNDFFLNIAKLRAARELLRQIHSHCNATENNCLLEAVSGTRSLTTLDASVNILRISTQTAAAMTGGANGFICTAYDHLTGSSEKATRLARNTQHILIEESGLLQVDDPARGSGYVEALTQELSRSAWQLFQQIEKAGGMHQALTSGLIAEQINRAVNQRIDKISSGKSTIIGVTAFPDLNEAPVEALQPVSVAPTKPRPDDEGVDVSVTALISALSAGESTLNFQRYSHSPVVSTALPSFRDAQRFEALRLRSSNYKSTVGHLPAVTLIALGNKKDYAARTEFCANFFAIAGIETNVIEITDITTLPGSMAEDSKLTVLCSSDSNYLTHAAATSALISGNSSDNSSGNSSNSSNSSSDSKNLWIAGNNAEVLSALSTSNITETIHLRCDKHTLLEKALTVLEVPA